MELSIVAAFTVALSLLLSRATADLIASGSSQGPCDLHPALRARIDKDLLWLDEMGGITDAMIRNISLVCDINVKHQCNVKAVRFMIKNGEVYLNSLHPEWRLGPPELIGFLIELYETSKMYRLPDLEFAYNGDDDASSPAFDWREPKDRTTVFHGGPFPLLAWSKSDMSFAQLVPYSGAFRCTDDSFDNLLLRLEEIRRLRWDDKREMALGRWNMFCAPYNYEMPPLPSGERFECPRSHLPSLTRHNADILDVAYLGDTGAGKRVAPVPLQHQNAYRYLVSTDGWAISSKFDKYLLLGSTIIKAKSSRYGFYYDALKSGEHYLDCMNSSASDLVERVRWLKEHDAEAQRMAENAQLFAVRHLHRGARLCYYRTLLEEMGKRMRYTPDCSQRKLCVPLGRLLEFLSTYERTAQTCRYAEVLLRYRAGPEPGAERYTDQVIRDMIKQEKFWPLDTDIPPLEREPYFPGG